MTSPRSGLSMYHISPRGNGGEAVFDPEPKITIRRGASLLSCQLGKIHSGRGRAHDWKRGRINSFSKQARRRMLRLVASLKRSMTPIFITLTYPDIFPGDPATWKKHIDILFKRLLRAYPAAVVVWRLERKERQSGQNMGQIAPHFHFLAYNVPYIGAINWFRKSWYEVVGSGNIDHYNAGSRVEQVRSVKGVLYYTSKYICKSENDVLEDIGRTWGVIGRGGLPGIQGEVEVIELTGNAAMMILRYMRRKGSECYKKGKYVGRRKVPSWGVKYTLIGDSEFWYKCLPKIQILAS